MLLSNLKTQNKYILQCLNMANPEKKKMMYLSSITKVKSSAFSGTLVAIVHMPGIYYSVIFYVNVVFLDVHYAVDKEYI